MFWFRLTDLQICYSFVSFAFVIGFCAVMAVTVSTFCGTEFAFRQGLYKHMKGNAEGQKGTRKRVSIV